MSPQHMLERALCVVACVYFLMIGVPALSQEGPAWNLTDLLTFSPADDGITCAWPSLSAAYETLDALYEQSGMAALPGKFIGSPLDMLQDIAEDLELGETNSLAELLEKTGVDGSRPVAVVMGDFEGEQMSLYLPIVDSERFAALLGFENGEPLEVSISGVPCRAGLLTPDETAYLFYRGYVVLAKSPDALRAAAQGIESPCRVHYSGAELPALNENEWVVRAHPDRLLAMIAAEDKDVAALANGIGGVLTAAYDEVVATAALQGKRLSLRIAAHQKAPGEAAPPLGLPNLLPANSIAMAGLRISPGLKNLARAVLESVVTDPAQRTQAQGFFTFITGLLGDEAAAAVPVISSEHMHFIAVVRSPTPKMIETSLGMADAPAAAGQYAGRDIYEINVFPPPADRIFYTSTEDLFLIGTRKRDIQALLDKVTGAVVEEAPRPFLATLLARANHGFLHVNGRRLSRAMQSGGLAMDMPKQTLELGNIQVRIEHHGTYGQVVCDIPNTLLSGPAMMLTALSGRQDPNARATSQNNLKQMGLVCKMYANESKGQVYPPISPVPGKLMIDAAAIYPEYLSDVTILARPGCKALEIDFDNPDFAQIMIDDRCYLYLSHAVTTEEEGLAYAEAYRKAAESRAGFEQDFDTPNGKLYRLREGVERFFITDIGNPAGAVIAQSRVLVMMERPVGETVEGINVLFMDGHVEYVRKGVFPYTDTFMNALLALDALEGT